MQAVILNISVQLVSFIQCQSDGTTVTVTCPTGYIYVEYANYGRTQPDTVVCPYSKQHKDDITCDSQKGFYLNLVRTNCQLQHTCAFTIGQNGDPCVGTYKYTEVLHYCAGSITSVNNTEREKKIVVL